MFGITINNTSGVAQIDANFENYLLVAQGTGQTVSNVGDVNNIPLPYGLTPNDCFIFVGLLPTDRYVILTHLSNSGFTLNGYIITTGASFSFPYRIYARSSKALAAKPPTGSYGVQVWGDSASRLTYDSRHQPLIFRDTIYFNSENDSTSTTGGSANPSNLGYTPWCSVYGTLAPYRAVAQPGGGGPLLGMAVGPRPNGLQMIGAPVGWHSSLNPFGIKSRRTFVLTS